MRSTVATTALVLACSSSFAGPTANPLIGHWVPDYVPSEKDGSPANCAASIDFTVSPGHIRFNGWPDCGYKRT